MSIEDREATPSLPQTVGSPPASHFPRIVDGKPQVSAILLTRQKLECPFFPLFRRKELRHYPFHSLAYCLIPVAFLLNLPYFTPK